MPWHVIAYHLRQKPEDPWLAADFVVRAEAHPDATALARAVNDREEELRRRFPGPDYQVVSGSGPESDSPEFANFVVWLLKNA